MSSAPTILDEIRARATALPEHRAIVAARADGAPTVTGYRELAERLEALGQEGRDAGIQPGDRVGLVARQGPGFVEQALGILEAGGCLVPIPDDHMGAVLDDFAARAYLEHLVVETPEGVEHRRVEAPHPFAHDAEFRALRPAYLRFTSGTTSERKGVVLGHAAILARLEAANAGLRIGPEDRVLWLLPMAHHFVVSILLYLSRGATLLLPAGSLARPILDLATSERATVLYASPYHYHLLSKDASEVRMDSVRLAISTAEGLRPAVAEAFRKRHGFALSQALGIMEAGLPCLNDRHGAEKPDCLGRPLPAYDVHLVEGEICIRGPGLFDAYLDPWIPARQITEPHGFRTGDQGRFDDDGELWLEGRRANRINMAGMKFFCEEVEAVLDRHPSIRRSRVSARVHPHLGEIPMAEIELEDGADAPATKELGAHCRAALPAYKIPRSFTVVEALPLTPTGKLARA